MNINAVSQFSARQFTIFRIIFGLYLTWHFATLIPYAEELFGPKGIMGAPGINPFDGKWPNLLTLIKTNGTATILIVLSTLGSVLFTLGKARKPIALFLWYSLSCLFTANPLIANPSLAYVGLLLLLTLLTPTGEKLLEASPDWQMPKMICITAWILLAAGYTFSGILKLSSPSWLDGSALSHLLANPLARPGFARDAMLLLPPLILRFLTWSVLVLEITYLPLTFFQKTRKWIWIAMVGMHIGIMTTVDFADLSLGMLMIHLFTFQSSWIPDYQRIFQKLIRRKTFILLIPLIPILINACSSQGLHNGRIPFSLLEKAPSKKQAARTLPHPPQQLQFITSYTAANDSANFDHLSSQIQAGDILAFHLSHREALHFLCQGKIQKIPYELFRYGHLALATPDPTKPPGSNDLRLLQVAMNQPVQIQDSLNELRDKNWHLYRVPSPQLAPEKLREFTRHVLNKGHHPKKSYDYSGALGFKNAPFLPTNPDEIGHEFTCTTLIVAALSYCGYELHTTKHKGYLDVITPRQVITSWGSHRLE